MASANIGKSVQNAEFDPSKASKSANDRLMSPNAKEDPETVTGDNPQKAWIGSGGKPQGPFGRRGRDF
jgi:hypothetical protein